MNNNNENIENPLAYSDLYRNGIYVIKEEYKVKEIAVISENIPKENDQTSPKNEERPILLSTQGRMVLNIVKKSNQYDSLALVTKIMQAVKINAQPLNSNDLEIIEIEEMQPLEIPDNTQYMLIWSDNSEKESGKWLQVSPKTAILNLPSAETAASTDAEKRAVWMSIKALFGMA
jgi:hypothetical protein